MMQHQKQLCDPKALHRNRVRAKKIGPELFLHEEALSEVNERLQLVKKDFTNRALVTGWPDLWTNSFQGFDIVDDADTLNLAPQSKDLVIHAMSLHWANDIVGQLIQCKRALLPDGFFLGMMFGGQTLHELRATLAEAEIAETDGLSPRIPPMAEIRDLGGLLQRAGFALPVADSITLNVQYSDAYALMRDLRAMGETNVLFDRPNKFTRRRIFSRMSELYAQKFPGDDGRITATFELIFLAGWAPHESQQQPLRPGSATQNLADALGSVELKLPSDD